MSSASNSRKRKDNDVLNEYLSSSCDTKRQKKPRSVQSSTSSSSSSIKFKKGFALPTRDEMIEALGFPNMVKERDIPVEYKIDRRLFAPLPKPKHADDWLAQYNEPRQSFIDWRDNYHRQINDLKNTIYLLPVGDFEGTEGVPNIATLQEFTQTWFNMPVKILPTLQIKEEGGHVVVHYQRSNTRSGRVVDMATRIRTRRCHPYDEHIYNLTHRQFCVDDLADVLLHMRPRDSYCLLALTLQDLYQDKKDSFIVGCADINLGIGGFSLARRYDPYFDVFSKVNAAKPKITEEERSLLLTQRAFKIIAHEIGHMFGLGHCAWMQCGMQGSGHLEEDYAQPLHWCPIDMRKLEHALRGTGFNMKTWYTRLYHFLRSVGLDKEAEWLSQRVQSFVEEPISKKGNDTDKVSRSEFTGTLLCMEDCIDLT